MNTETQRRRDAAFFEDWSAWGSLDDLPPPDRQAGHFLQWPSKHNRYWCMLRSHVDWLGGAAFELSLPPDHPTCLMVAKLPGARQHPALLGRNRHAYRKLDSTYFVPAENWQAVRSALPAIKAAVVKWAESRP